MKCPKCQTDNPELKKFCRECGAKLALPCPGCGAEVIPGDKFCGECGHDLRKTEETIQVDYSQPQSYTPQHLKDKILTTRSSIEGERKLVTVFFADVANFTPMSEKLDPEEVHQIMDGCFKILMDEIHKYEGTINQFTGDGIMALFGAPVAHEDHAQRACYAALSVQRIIEGYGEKIKRETGIDFRMRIGLNSGHVIVGSIGDDLRMDYTAVGDTTNLAARMESMAEPGSIMVSNSVYRLAKDFFEFESLGKLTVKGKQESQEAYKLIRAGEIETRISASVAKGLTRFIGRKNSMLSLMEAYNQAKNGSGQVVGIVGEAGVGKSRLLLEMRNRIPPDEYTYLEGRCLNYGGSMSYLPIMDILRDYFDIQETDRAFIIRKKIRDKISALNPSMESAIAPFQDLLSLKVDDEKYLKQDSQVKRNLIFEALRDVLLRESQQKALVLAIEDLHWIDKTSEDFLNYLIGWIANAPILLILLYRPEYTHQWGSKSYYNRIGLDQLGTESSSELISAMLEEGEVAPELREIILNRAAGNPLFMEEFTHTLLENGTIKKINHQYILTQDLSEINVPDTIQGIIAARMDRLEDNLKRTMQVASVIGRDFAFRILQTITGMRDELKSYLLNLQGLEFIYEKALFPELEYIFKHALTQEVAYNSLLQKRRQEIHKRIGRAIEEIYTDRLEEFYGMLVYHYIKGEDYEKGVDYSKLAGKKALQAGAFTEAIAYAKSVIFCLEKLPQTEENQLKTIRARTVLAMNCLAMNYHVEAKEAVEPIVDLALEMNTKQYLSIIYTALGTYNWAIEMDASSAIKNLEKAISISEEIHNYQSLAAATYFLGNVQAQLTCDFDKALSNYQRALDLALAGNAIQFAIAYKSTICLVLGALNKVDLAHQTGMELLKMAQDYDERSKGFAHVSYGIACFHKGLFKESEKHLLEGLGFVDHSSQLSWATICSNGLGELYYYMGDYEKSERYFNLAISYQDQSRNLPPSFGSFKVALMKAELMHRGIDIDLNELFGCYDTNKWKLGEGNIASNISEILLHIDDQHLEEAEEWVIKAIESYERYGMLSQLGHDYVIYAEISKRKGDSSKVREKLIKAIEIFKECGADGWMEKYEKELAYLY